MSLGGLAKILVAIRPEYFMEACLAPWNDLSQMMDEPEPKPKPITSDKLQRLPRHKWLPALAVPTFALEQTRDTSY